MSSRVDRVLEEIQNFTAEEIRSLIMKMAERYEHIGWLMTAETAFSDWDNEEDAVYDEI